LSDIYDNYKTIDVCKENERWCRIVPNPCCRYKPGRDVKPCGKDYDCLYWNENYLIWEKPGILKFLVFMIAQFFVQFLILFIIETNPIRNLRYFMAKSMNKMKKSSSVQQIEIEKLYGDIGKDSDVLDEENRISKMNDDLKKQEIFIADKLTKNYENFMAVKGISFGMKDSECFGLLGVNGAGKTSTFKMITGDELITQGEAYLNQISVKKDIKKVFFYNCINYFLKL